MKASWRDSAEISVFFSPPPAFSTEGIFTEPAGGVSVSVLQKMVEQGKIDKNDKVVCYVTGNGLKATESIMEILPKPTVYEPNINEISAVVQ